MRSRKFPIALAVSMVVLLSGSVLADTLVMRSGERVEIGAQYRIDGAVVEYRSSSGQSRSVLLKDVDLDATARANGIPVTAFVERAMRRAPARPRREVAPAPADPQGAPVTVTNADLEPYRAERERQDAEYRLRNPEPYPPVRPREEADPRYDRPTSRSNLYGGYSLAEWQREARFLRDQLDAERAQMDTIRSELAFREENPFDYRLSFRYNFGNAPLILGPSGTFVNPFPATVGVSRADAEFYRLSTLLQDLEIQHRATLSRWDNFRERARRVGVPPGILRDY